MMILISCFMDLMTDVLKQKITIKKINFTNDRNYEELLKFT